MLQTATTVPALRSIILPWREKGETVALVPTMGALHRGHMSLVALGKKLAMRVVATIFVNPTQFAPTDDFNRYPRSLEADKKMLLDAGCDALFAPTVDVMYPQGFTSVLDPGPLATVLEGVYRPGHFAGVATVVTKLLLQALPDVAIFGEKDFQQLQVIRRVVRDLDLPVQIVGAPIIRDDDDLALSTRNAYLSTDERTRAATLPRTLRATIGKLRAGADVQATLKEGRATLAAVGFAVDYLELADPVTMLPVRELKTGTRLLVAAKIGATRLIDNMEAA